MPSTGILTKMAPEQKMLMDVVAVPNEDIFFIPCAENTSMTNQYLSADRERRRLIVQSVADPFRITDVPDVESEIFHLAGLINGDFEPGKRIKNGRQDDEKLLHRAHCGYRRDRV